MNQSHEADPHFLEHMAWQTRTAVRRETRFARPAGGPSSRLQRSLRSAALVLVSVLGGAATVVAAERVQDLRERQLVLASIDVRLETAELRRSLADEEVARRRAMHDAGLASASEFAALESDLARAEETLRRLEFDRAEVVDSGRAPRDELFAPLVAGRDYVTERMQLTLLARQEIARARRARLEIVEARFEHGIIAQDTLEETRLQALLAERDLDLLRQHLDLRREHLAGATTPEQVELLGLRAEVASRLVQAELRVQQARRLHDVLQERVRAGLVGPSEASRAELDLFEAQSDLKLAQLELAGIDARLGR